MRNRLVNSIIVIAFMIITTIIVIACCQPIRKVVKKRTEVGTVTEKEVKRNGDDDKYLIFSKDKEGEVAVYEITDSLFAGRFNSSDVYGGIEVGKTYKFTVEGYRNGLFSWYPNIYEYEEISIE